MLKSFNVIVYLICIKMFLISVESVHAQGMNRDFMDQSDRYFKKFTKKIHNRSLVVGLYYQGRDTILTYGHINLLGRRSSENDLYQIGSISKTFTGLIFADAVVNGRLSLTDTLANLLEIKNADKYDKTTLIELATHTSGLPGNTITLHALPMASYITLSLSKKFLLEAIGAPSPFIDIPWQLLIIPPPIPYFSTYGAKSVNFDLNHFGINQKKVGTLKYSNLGMGVLGRIVSKPYSNSYEEALNDIICEPLDMERTTTSTSRKLKKHYATPHNLIGFRVFRTKFKNGGIEGAGGIKSTGTDMLKYLRLQMDSTYYPPLWEAIKLQHTSYFISKNPKQKGLEVGLSWFKYNPEEDTSSTIIWHNGQVSGSSAFVGFNKEKQVGIFVLANNPRANKITKDSFRILNYMLQNNSSN